jgi:hypothetical protein
MARKTASSTRERPSFAFICPLASGSKSLPTRTSTSRLHTTMFPPPAPPSPAVAAATAVKNVLNSGRPTSPESSSTGFTSYSASLGNRFASRIFGVHRDRVNSSELSSSSTPDRPDDKKAQMVALQLVPSQVQRIVDDPVQFRAIQQTLRSTGCITDALIAAVHPRVFRERLRDMDPAATNNKMLSLSPGGSEYDERDREILSLFSEPSPLSTKGAAKTTVLSPTTVTDTLSFTPQQLKAIQNVVSALVDEDAYYDDTEDSFSGGEEAKSPSAYSVVRTVLSP